MALSKGNATNRDINGPIAKQTPNRRENDHDKRAVQQALAQRGRLCGRLDDCDLVWKDDDAKHIPDTVATKIEIHRSDARNGENVVEHIAGEFGRTEK